MNILITGATGLIATETILLLLNNKDYYLTLLTRDKNEARNRFSKFDSQIEYFTLEEAILLVCNPAFDIVVHTAFSRSSRGSDIANSLTYLSDLCEWLRKGQIGKFINISSQSVYGSNYMSGVDESCECSPDYLYAMGKYASELIVKGYFSDRPTQVINLRLASVCENARFMRIFVDKSLKGESILLTAPRQTVSFIDVRDVASAILSIILDRHNCSGTYNLGTGRWYTIQEVTQRIKTIGEGEYNIPPFSLTIDDSNCTSTIGMSNKLFRNTFNWYPRFSLDDMIRSLFEMLTNVNGGGYPISFKLVYHL